MGLDEKEPETLFPALNPLETVIWDYKASRHSTRGHPVGAIRGEISSLDLPSAEEVAAMPHGATARYAGLVICRQRPGTAKGVTFLTLEDETGFVNVIVWKKVYERFVTLVKTALLLGVTGKLQIEEGVVHVIAREIWVPQLSLKRSYTRSRDFR